jgi:arabinofuranosyltransferase
MAPQTELRERVSSRWIVFTVSVAVFLVLAQRFFDHTVDDAFISFRYAENLANGLGPVFNPGERVEGYTNFLWVVLIAPFIALDFEPESVARLLGLAAAIGTLGATTRMSARPDDSPEIVWIAPLLLASNPAFAVWATGGLETPLFTCLLAWAVVGVTEALPRKSLGVGSALCLAGAALTRPEGLGLALVIGALLIVHGYGSGARARAFLWWSLVFLSIFIPFFAWRWSYYGDPLPNTFYVKVGSDASQVLRGLKYIWSYFHETGFLLLISFFGLRWSAALNQISILLGVLVAFVGYVVIVGGDGLPMYRFLVPIIPLFCLLVGAGVAGVLPRIRGNTHFIVAIAIVLAFAAFRAGLPAFRGDAAAYVAQDRVEVAGWKQIGTWLRNNAATDASLAVIPAGAMPYYSKLETIDMLGLTDRTIAHREMPDLGSGQAGHEKYDVEYVLSRRPTFIMIGVYGLSQQALPARSLVQPYYPAEIRMLESTRFQASYRLHRGRTPDGYFAYFQRMPTAD